MQLSIPAPVIKIISILRQAGYEAYAAGEGVRDCLLGLEPQKLKVASSAPPEVVEAFFDRTLRLQNKVLVREGEAFVHVLSFGEQHCAAGSLSDLLEQDFTVNALAYDPLEDHLIDPWQLADQIASGEVMIRLVGDPNSRFQEKPRRLLEVFYLMKLFDDADLQWQVFRETEEALVRCAPAAEGIHPHRVRDLLNRVIMGKQPDIYLEEMRKTGVLRYVLPELDATYGIEQNDCHIKDVFGHTLLVMREIRPELHLRWAALLHDIGKPQCIGLHEGTVHFYGHQVIGSFMARRILRRLGFSRGFIEKVSFLVYHHMYPYPKTPKAVRRFINKMGLYNLGDLLELRRADILGGKYRNLSNLENFKREIDSVLFELPPFSIKNLALNGFDVMEVLGIEPGPLVGEALEYLFAKVKDNRELNNRESLTALLKERFES
ncbi:MAG TPA: HD domain-containing protein [Syntrophaceticus sp.]|nr:HD domain-containing protein [Syntrophaceticus sp.]